MCTTKKSVKNCLECGKFCSNKNGEFYCKKCLDEPCKNCSAVNINPPHRLDKEPNFCNTTCKIEYFGKEIVNKAVSDLIKGINVLRNANHNFSSKVDYRYVNKDFLLINDYQSKESTFLLNTKYNSQQTPETVKKFTKGR